MNLDLTSNMYNKYASAPELYVRSAETQTNPKNPQSTKTNTSVPVEDISQSFTQSTYTQYEYPTTSDSRTSAFKFQPSRIEFLAKAYVLLGVLILLASIQWMAFTYRWRPMVSAAERNLNLVLLLLIWLNLTLAFFGFRRLQLTCPLNYILFACIFESQTLFVMLLCMRELDLTWHIVVISIVVLLAYTALGLWLPPFLTVNLWILILLSVTVFVVSTLALITSLSMHCYVPLTMCVMVFGPWTMYNTFHLHAATLDPFTRFKYLKHAAQMYIAFGCTVGGLAVVSRITYDAIELERCKAVVFCQKRSISVTYVAEH